MHIKTAFAAATLCVSLFIAGPVHAALITVNFDDLVGDGTVANGYGGINWGGLWQYYDDDQPPYTAHSPSHRIYNLPRVSDQPFSFVTPDQVFLGGWFAGVSNFAQVGFDLYNNGGLVFSTPRTFISDVPLFVGSGYAGAVDEVRVFSSEGDFYVLDDITYETDAVAPVPEPASMVLLGTGLAAAFLVRRRRRG